METINKQDFITLVAEKAGLTKKDAGAAVAAYHEAISEQLVKGNKVSFVGFGNYEVRERAARTGRNPHTGEEIEIAATKVPVFKAGKTFKEAVKNG